MRASGRSSGSGVALLLAVLAVAGIVAGCSLLPGEVPLLRAEDCFGTVPYAFSGWTTLDAIGQQDPAAERPAPERVYAMVTRDEIVLTVSPPAADGSTFSLMGRGACWTWPGAPGVSKASIGETHQQPNR
jgi:hypothetical protein